MSFANSYFYFSASLAKTTSHVFSRSRRQEWHKLVKHNLSDASCSGSTRGGPRAAAEAGSCLASLVC